MNLTLHKPTLPIAGKVYLPGSKSISNRVLIIKALSSLSFNIINLSDSDDTRHLENALHDISNSTSSSINIGHAGTDMRFLTAFLSIKKGSWHLTGSERMQQRPIKELVDVLKLLGADITYKKQDGFPPLLIKGSELAGGKVSINATISSQFITSLLLVAPYFTNGLELVIEKDIVSKPYIEMTVELMKKFGASVNWQENTIHVKPVPYSYSKIEYAIESDWSAASYFYSMIAFSPINTQLTLSTLYPKSLQADTVCSQLFESFGVKTEYLKNGIIITKTNNQKSDIQFNYNFINCPDIAQTLSCTCVGLNQSFYFTGLQTLTLKETDRILALKNELEKFGITIQITKNSIAYQSKSLLDFNNPITISTYNDHRMAMSFAPLSFLFDNLTINDAEVVSKSYPLFWEDLKGIGLL